MTHLRSAYASTSSRSTAQDAIISWCFKQPFGPDFPIREAEPSPAEHELPAVSMALTARV